MSFIFVRVDGTDCSDKMKEFLNLKLPEHFYNTLVEDSLKRAKTGMDGVPTREKCARCCSLLFGVVLKAGGQNGLRRTIICFCKNKRHQYFSLHAFSKNTEKKVEIPQDVLLFIVQKHSKTVPWLIRTLMKPPETCTTGT